jgi:cell wall-associated NlpC family hydrolase
MFVHVSGRAEAPGGPWGEAAATRPGYFASPNPTGHPSQAADEGLRMTALNRVPSLMARAGTASALTLAAVGSSIAVPGLATDASAASLATKALQIAASKKGSPYQWGATGPYRFDCSGLTLYSFKKAGKKLPRTAAQQYNRTHHISAHNRKAGDLVFFHSGSYVYHVGIYAGHNKIWHAPKTGDVVKLQKIWTKSVWYGRVS